MTIRRLPLLGSPQPYGLERIVGGLVGVVGGESWQGARGGFVRDGSELGVTAALLDVARSYVAHPWMTPVEAAKRHEGVPAPGWLLPVAVMRADEGDMVEEALELAVTAGVRQSALDACRAYVKLARDLFSGRHVSEAVLLATGKPWSSTNSEPLALCGSAEKDALAAGIWALGQPGRLCDVVSSLAGYAKPHVVAAAMGLLGLRDGCVATPAQWHRQVPGVGAHLLVGQLLAASAGVRVLAGSVGGYLSVAS